ncbi:Putative Potential zinc finger protein [Rhizopus microsporus]|nr:Putative Potential zinc finger protein [Rhizopus microsporus]
MVIYSSECYSPIHIKKEQDTTYMNYMLPAVDSCLFQQLVNYYNYYYYLYPPHAPTSYFMPSTEPMSSSDSGYYSISSSPCSSDAWPCLQDHSPEQLVKQEPRQEPKQVVKLVEKKPVDMSSRRYKCTRCPRAFTRKHDLERHIRVHTGDKPYHCPCCKKCFARSDALKRHIQVEIRCRTSEEVITFRQTSRRRQQKTVNH